MANNNYIFKDNSRDKGGFSHVPSYTRNRNTDDEMIGAGTALIIGGLIGAAAVAAAIDDDDYNARRAAEIRREAERRAAYGMTSDEVVHEVVKYCMKERLSDKMVVMTAIVRELLEAQGATIKSVEGRFGELRMEGRCVDGTDLRIVLNSVGGITVYAYDAKLMRFSTSSKVFKEYEILVTNANKYEKLARVMAY